jgi:hypothetical protein
MVLYGGSRFRNIDEAPARIEHARSLPTGLGPARAHRCQHRWLLASLPQHLFGETNESMPFSLGALDIS